MNQIAQDLFTRALELPESECDAFVAQACGDDAELRLEVQRLLVDAARADSFFGGADVAILVGEPDLGTTVDAARAQRKRRPAAQVPVGSTSANPSRSNFHVRFFHPFAHDFIR